MNAEIRQCQDEIDRLNAELAACQAQRQEIDAYLQAAQGKLSAAEAQRKKATTLNEVRELGQQVELITSELAAARTVRQNLDTLAGNLQTALATAENSLYTAQERHRKARQDELMATIGPDLLRPLWLILALELRGAAQPVGVRATMSRMFGCLPGPDPSEIPDLYRAALSGE